MAKTAKSVSRRTIIVRAVETAAAAAIGGSAGGCVAAGHGGGNPEHPACRSPNGNARQADAFSIRECAAVQSVYAPPAEQEKFDATTDGEARARQYAKPLRRDTADSRDPLLPMADAFDAFKKTLNEAHARTLTREGFPDAPDSYAVDQLAKYIGLAGEPSFKLTNPLGGFSFETEGLDPASSHMPAHPAFDSAQTAAEMAELYWMALLRDHSFRDLDPETEPTGTVKEAIDELLKFRWFNERGLDVRTFLRARLPKPGHAGFEGVSVGPYLSQFLLRGNEDPANPDVTPDQGFVNFGTLRLSQRQRTVISDRRSDYLQDPRPVGPPSDPEAVAQWWVVHSGSRRNIGKDQFRADDLYFISKLRDGANYVHFDEIYQEYLIAASILLNQIPRVGNNLFVVAAGRSPATQQRKSKHLPQVSESGLSPDQLLNYGNPYRNASAQVGFATFGVTQMLTLVAEISTRAHKAGWYHKWLRLRIRPEEFGARVQAKFYHTPIDYGINSELFEAGAEVLRRIRDYNAQSIQGVDSYLLPIAFPEGCPTHPAYPSGHATVAGAAVTVLKAIFNETFPLTGDRVGQPPLVPSEDGKSLEPYANPNLPRNELTVGGELNKLASNVVYFRSIAGMHWQSDNIQGLLLGERVAIELLTDQTLPATSGTPFYRERWRRHSTDRQGQSPFFRFTTFSGRAVDIADGQIFDLTKHDPTDPETWTREGRGMSFKDYITRLQ